MIKQRIQGSLDETWSESLAGMTITTSGQGSQTRVTMLVGQLRDQAELSGVLNTLYGLQQEAKGWRDGII